MDDPKPKSVEEYRRALEQAKRDTRVWGFAFLRIAGMSFGLMVLTLWLPENFVVRITAGMIGRVLVLIGILAVLASWVSFQSMRDGRYAAAVFHPTRPEDSPGSRLDAWIRRGGPLRLIDASLISGLLAFAIYILSYWAYSPWALREHMTESIHGVMLFLGFLIYPIMWTAFR